MSWYVMTFYLFPLFIFLGLPLLVLLMFALAGESTSDFLSHLLNRGPKLTCWHCGRETPSDRSTCVHCKGELQ